MSVARHALDKIPSGEHLVVTRALGFRVDATMTVFEANETIVNDVALKVAVNAERRLASVTSSTVSCLRRRKGVA